MDLDDTDRQVIDALLDDGRATDRDIAAETGIVANRVADRRQKLESAGVIQGYTARIDYDQLDYDVTAVFELAVDGDGLTSVVERLSGFDGMTAVYEVTGDHDIVAVGKFTSTETMNARIKDLLTDPAVRAVTTSVVLNVVKENTPLPLGE